MHKKQPFLCIPKYTTIKKDIRPSTAKAKQRTSKKVTPGQHKDKQMTTTNTNKTENRQRREDQQQDSTGRRRTNRRRRDQQNLKGKIFRT